MSSGAWSILGTDGSGSLGRRVEDRLLIEMEYSKGDSIDPCNTPACGEKQNEVVFRSRASMCTSSNRFRSRESKGVGVVLSSLRRKILRSTI